MNSSIDAILVPQGAEYQAVCRGLKQAKCQQIKVISVPIGIKNITKCLENKQLWQIKPQTILIMGLCGSLSSQYLVGDKILYKTCNFNGKSLATDNYVTNAVWQKLSESVSLADSLTSDRTVCQVKEKLRLAKIYPNSVVDMEGYAYLHALQKRGVSVAMLRVVSDDLTGDLPKLDGAIDNEGNLKTLTLAIAMLRQPIAAARLIKGSLIALKALEQVTVELFGN